MEALQTILKSGGFEVRLGSLDETITSPFEIMLSSGKAVLIEPLFRVVG